MIFPNKGLVVCNDDFNCNNTNRVPVPISPVKFAKNWMYSNSSGWVKTLNYQGQAKMKTDNRSLYVVDITKSSKFFFCSLRFQWTDWVLHLIEASHRCWDVFALFDFKFRSLGKFTSLTPLYAELLDARGKATSIFKTSR